MVSYFCATPETAAAAANIEGNDEAKSVVCFRDASAINYLIWGGDLWIIRVEYERKSVKVYKTNWYWIFRVVPEEDMTIGYWRTAAEQRIWMLKWDLPKTAAVWVKNSKARSSSRDKGNKITHRKTLHRIV